MGDLEAVLAQSDYDDRFGSLVVQEEIHLITVQQLFSRSKKSTSDYGLILSDINHYF